MILWSSSGAISNIPMKMEIFFVDLSIRKLDLSLVKKKKNTLVRLKQGSIDSEVVRNISMKHGQSISLGIQDTFWIETIEPSKALPAECC